MGAATGAAGGASALQAAFKSAQAAESAAGGMGGDLMSVMGGGSSKGGNDAGSVFGDDPSDDSIGGESSDKASVNKGESCGRTGESKDGENSSGKVAGSDAKGSSGDGGKSGGMMAKASRIAAGTASTLAQGVTSAASSKLQEFIADTAGGRLAASINERRLDAESAATSSSNHPESPFQGDSLSSGSLSDEVMEFVNKKPPQE